MMVVDNDSFYNAIIGHLWVNEIGALVFIFHQTINFPNGNKVERLRKSKRQHDHAFSRLLREVYN